MDAVKNRYMFDTSALDALCKTEFEDETKIYATKEKGFEYYFTETQLEESEKNIRAKSNPSADIVTRENAERAANMLRVVSKIQTKYVGQIATLTENRWILDGTFELLPDGNELAWEVYTEILNDNPFQHYNDAIIALTGLANGCTLVVNDRRFRNIVNKHLPGRAITYAEFMERL